MKILVTKGQGKFQEFNWACAEPKPTEIRVRSLLTGVCRSDIDMMVGKFIALPEHMSGHEGLAQVTAIGQDVLDVQVGQLVATRGEPAYADEYCVRSKEYVRVPECHPRYILEPVACGINCIIQNLQLIESKHQGRMLIMGSGFLSWVAYNTVKLLGIDMDITVVGNHNGNLWGAKLKQDYQGKFDVVLDLGSSDLFNQDIYMPGAVYIYAAQKTTTSDLKYLLWNACTIVCPSPRTDKFYQAMVFARDFIEQGKINIDFFWTKGYARDNFEQAFEDGIQRPAGYSRGYIDWR